MSQISGILTIIGIATFLTSSFSVGFGRMIGSDYVQISTKFVPDDYSTIQAAINDAHTGDIIVVRPGTYYENVILNKSVTLAGMDVEKTVIDGSFRGDVVRLTVSASITGFTIRNSGDYPYGGITLEQVSNCTVTRNIISDNYEGVGLNSVFSSRASYNFITRNKADGFAVMDSHNNLVESNEITLCGNMGIEVGQLSSDNTIWFNTVSQTGGILLVDSDENNVTNNLVAQCTTGLWLQHAHNNLLSENRLVASIIGVSLFYTSGNAIYHNDVINSTQAQAEAFNSGGNLWDNGYPSGGNYWSNYSVVDQYQGIFQNQTGSDGIGDIPFVILDPSDIDNYPLQKPWLQRTISIIEADTGSDAVTLSKGQSFGINITLDGKTDFLNGFQVAIRFDNTKVNCTAAWVPGLAFMTPEDPSFVFYGVNSTIFGSHRVYNDLGFAEVSFMLQRDFVVPNLSIGQYVNVTGSRLLCRMNFTAIATGPTTIDLVTRGNPGVLFETSLTDWKFNQIDYIASEDLNLRIASKTIQVAFKVTPQALNLRSRGKWVTASVILPEGYVAKMIDFSTLTINNTLAIKAGNLEDSTFTLKIDREMLEDFVIAGTVNLFHRQVSILRLTGQFEDGSEFSGTARIISINDLHQRPH